MRIVVAAMAPLVFSTELAFAQDRKAHEQAPVNERAQEAAGLADAYRIQSEALRRGDVLARISRYTEPDLSAPNRDLVEHVKYYRWIFDFDVGDCYFFCSGEVHVTEAGEEGKSKQAVTELRGFVLSDGQAITRTLGMREDGPRRSPRAADIYQLMHRFDVPALHTIGFGTFGSVSPSLNREAIAEPFATVGFAQDTKPASPDQQILTFGRSVMPKLDYEVVWLFDLRRYVPLTVDKYHLVQQPDNRKLHRQRIMRERFAWEERNGALVPVAINVDQHSTNQNPDGKLERTIHYADVKMHWFSVNEPLDPQYFNFNLIEDLPRLTQSVDPRATNAESLLDDSTQ